MILSAAPSLVRNVILYAQFTKYQSLILIPLAYLMQCIYKSCYGPASIKSGLEIVTPNGSIH